MLKALIRKQFMELFKSYLLDRKTGKPRSKAKKALLFGLFGLIMLYLCAMFFGLAYVLGDSLIAAGLDSLYFALMGTMSCILGVFGSVFNTFAALYLAKDNDLLISMPIPASTILISRLTGVAGMSLLYSSCVWLPAVVYYCIRADVTVLSVVFGLLLSVFIALFVTVLSCILGWVVALISKRLKNKSIITVLISLVFLGLYYMVCFRLNDIIMSMVNNAGSVESSVKTWLNLMYQLGKAATGDAAGMLIFCGITAALTALCYFVMSKTFVSLATGGNTAAKSRKRERIGGQASVKKALLVREFRRFTASATYMLNCGLGIFMLPVMAVFALIKKEALMGAVAQFASFLPGFEELTPLAAGAMLCMLLSMNMISTPSISLEGKNLWLLKSLPVSAKEVLRAKLYLHLLLNIPVGLVSAVILCCALGISAVNACAVLLMAAAITVMTGSLGLVLGLKRPNFNWTSEQVVIKQGMNVFVMLFGSWLVVIAIAAGGWFLRNAIAPALWVFICGAVMLAVSAGLIRWLDTRGVCCFESL